MAPGHSGQTSLFSVVFFVFKSLLGIERRKKLKKFTFLTRKPRSHVRIMIYRTWAIVHLWVIGQDGWILDKRYFLERQLNGLVTTPGSKSNSFSGLLRRFNLTLHTKLTKKFI